MKALSYVRPHDPALADLFVRSAEVNEAIRARLRDRAR
jgi:hypothetical protein